MAQEAANIKTLRRPKAGSSVYLEDMQARDKKLSESIKELDKVLGNYDPPEAANDSPSKPVKVPLQPAANDTLYDGESVEIAKDQLDVQETGVAVQEKQNTLIEDVVEGTNVISTKLTVLSDRLREKYEAANQATTDVPEPVKETDKTTSEILGERNKQPEVKTEPELPQIVQTESKPSEDLTSKGDNVKGAPGGAAATMLINGVQGVKSAVTTGFAKSASIADRISGMLFKFTLTQAANAAKIAAAIFLIILGLDVLKAVWTAWGEKIMAKFDEWGAKLSEWWEGLKNWSSYFVDMKDSFEGMQGDLMGIRNAWESGDWPALAKSIGVAFIDGVNTLGGIFDRVITKLLATILDKLGFTNAAKAVEAEGLQRYQNMTNNRLSEENQRKLAEEQLRREKSDKLTPTQRGVTSFLPDSFRNFVGILDNNEMGQIQAEKKDQAARQALSHEDQLKNVAAANEAREAVARLKNVADNANPNNKEQMAKVDKYKKEAEDYINNAALSKTPNVQAELKNQLEALTPKSNVKNNVRPAKSAEANDSQTAKNILALESQKRADAVTAGMNVVNASTNIVKSNKSFNIQAPITSTRAPGVFGATGVN